MTSIKQGGPKVQLPAEYRARLALMAARAWAQQLASPEIALAFVNGELDSQLELPPDADINTVVNAVLAVGRERMELIDRLHAALIADNLEEILTLARKLCNLPEKGDERHDARGPQAVH